MELPHTFKMYGTCHMKFQKLWLVKQLPYCCNFVSLSQATRRRGLSRDYLVESHLMFACPPHDHLVKKKKTYPSHGLTYAVMLLHPVSSPSSSTPAECDPAATAPAWHCRCPVNCGWCPHPTPLIAARPPFSLFFYHDLPLALGAHVTKNPLNPEP